MVDTGPLHPESVIDLALRQRNRGGQSGGAGSASDGGYELLSLPFLQRCLSVGNEQVQMWAAYQLLDRWRDASEQYVEHLFASPLAEIRESAINLIGRYKLQRFAFPLLRLLKTDEDGLRLPAALALASLRYEPAGRALQAWYQGLMAENEQPPATLDVAVQSLLTFDTQRFWPEVYAALEGHRQNHSVFAILFRRLCAAAATGPLQAAVAEAYIHARGIFNDIGLTRELVAMAGRPTVSLYLQSRLNSGYPLPSIYHECLQVLGVTELHPETEALIGRLAGCTNTRTGIERYLPIGTALIKQLVRDPARAAVLDGFLHGCDGWLQHWEEAILKLREHEYYLLISLPLVGLLEDAESACLADPAGETLRIARIYQSPLLSPGFMRQVLNLMAHRMSDSDVALLRATPFSGWLRDDEKATLWKLFTDQLDGVEHPFARTLPQPWEFRIPALMERLARLLQPRFETYLAMGHGEAVDYCLEVFRREGGAAMIPLMLRHFDGLMTHHYSSFIEFMTHLPDERFLGPLVHYHREGEHDLERLIRFISDVHGLPHPAQLTRESPQSATPERSTSVRLLCHACGGAYQYPVPELYVNLERIEQRLIPSARDLWVPEPICCKKCHAALHLEPDMGFLQDLYTELLASRMLHGAADERSSMEHVHLIHFPVLDGRTLNPADFLLEVQRAIGSAPPTGAAVKPLLELGRFYLEIGHLADARQTLQRILAGPVKSPHALFYMGVLAFQEKNLYEARVYFSRLVSSCSREEFENDPDNPLDMAQHYLRLLDKRDFKRSQFQIISS